MNKYLYWIVLSVISGIVCAFIAKRKGYNAALWFMFGALFNVIAVGLLSLMKSYRITKRW